MVDFTCEKCHKKATPEGGNIMNEYRERIRNYVVSCFEPGSIVKYEDFPLLPGGVRIFDKNGDEAVFYFDLLDGKLYYAVPNDKNPNLAAYPGEW